MSGGGGGPVIIGDEFVKELEDHADKVAHFRLARMTQIITEYRKNENSVTRDEQLFLFRCAADVIDNV